MEEFWSTVGKVYDTVHRFSDNKYEDKNVRESVVTLIKQTQSHISYLTNRKRKSWIIGIFNLICCQLYFDWRW